MAYACAVIAVTTHNSSTVLHQMFYTVLVETHPRKTHQPKPRQTHMFTKCNPLFRCESNAT